MQTTTHYALQKPDPNDTYNKATDNSNMDAIDTQMYDNAQAAAAAQTSAISAQTTANAAQTAANAAQTTANAAIPQTEIDAANGVMPLDLNKLAPVANLPIATSSEAGIVKPAEGLIVDTDGTLKNPWAVRSLSNVLSPNLQLFTRSTPAGRVNGNQVSSNVLRLEQGRFHKAPFLEEATTNLVPNSGFNTVTGTAIVFQDTLLEWNQSTMPAPWALQSGSFTFGASGATSGTNTSIMITGNTNWKPLVGSNGSLLLLTVQATVTTQNVLTGDSGAVYLFQSAGYYYVAFLQTGGFTLGKYIGGVYTQLATVAQTISTSTPYTITLSIDVNGDLVSKLYSGVGIGGTLLQTLTKTDTSLGGGFFIGIGGDTGVIVSHPQATAPFADGWTIGGDSRIAWALTLPSNSINGTYSANGVGMNGASGWIACAGYSYTSGNPYTSSAYVTTNGMGTGGAYLSANTNVGVVSSKLTGTNSTPVRISATSNATASGTNNSSFWIADVGSATFDMVQVEQKAYATTYIENNVASGTVTRNADSLSFTLNQPLPSRWFIAFVWKPQQSSSVTRQSGDYPLVVQMTNSVLGRFEIAYLYSDGKLHFADFSHGDLTLPVAFNASDTLYIAVLEDPTNDIRQLWVAVNSNPIQTTSDTNVITTADVNEIFLGCAMGQNGFEANGPIEAMIHPLATGETVTTDEVTAFFAATDWGLGDYQGFNPQTARLNGTQLAQIMNSGLYKIQSGTAGPISLTGGTFATYNLQFPTPFTTTWILVTQIVTPSSGTPSGIVVETASRASNSQAGLSIYSPTTQTISLDYIVIGI